MADRLLLDTCAAVWLMAGEELSAEIVEQIDAAARQGTLFISPVTAWEIAMLVKKERLVLTSRPQDWYEQLCSLPGIIEHAVNARSFTESVDLPGELHKDPADRLFIATARLSNLVLVTRDRKIFAYSEQGHVRALAC